MIGDQFNYTIFIEITIIKIKLILMLVYEVKCIYLKKIKSIQTSSESMKSV